MGHPSLDFDLIIIGAGIVGAGIFRDASFHGISTLLIDKGDFSSQTSQSSSKMLHGGIRYLENFDFELVAEALREKNLLLKMAPHLCYQSPFLFPTFPGGKYKLWQLGLGLTLYDLLSQSKHPNHHMLSKEQTLHIAPQLTDSCTGAGIYYDAIVDDARMTIDLIMQAKRNYTECLNYTEVIKFNEKKEKCIITVRQVLTGEQREISCRQCIFALGPFTDQVLKKLQFNRWQEKLSLSKGIHLWLAKKSLEITCPIVLLNHDDRVIFVIPHRDAILVGTTESPLAADSSIFNITALPEEINYLLNALKNYFPKANIEQKDILQTFAGVRPLVKESSHKNIAKISRNHQIYQLSNRGHVIVGGKYTTFRVMAADICKRVFPRLGIVYQQQLSMTPIAEFVPKRILSSEEIKKLIKRENIQTIEDLWRRRLSYYSYQQFQSDYPMHQEIQEFLPTKP